ncbi:MAG: diguanylate cyclase, partial [Actinomycetota bacterium]|nr:diguanylate cyclase [Actinomycetota bacterium]
MAWSGTLRATDALARYGGEEFALLLPGSSLDAAATVLGRLRAITPEGVTLSAGLAQAEVNETA